MSDPESRILGFGIAGSVAVHLLAGLMFACWVAFAPAPAVVSHPPDPPVEVILPENIELVATPSTPTPAPEPVPEPDKPKPKPSERYIRTTQNEEEAAAPKKADFVSDRNTTAVAKAAADPKADEPLPASKGVPIPTMELANRNYKDGEIKNDSAPTPPASPPPMPVPPKKQEPQKPAEKNLTEPPPPPEKIAKKEDAPAEKMMKELDAALLKDNTDKPPPEVPKAKPVEPADKTPSMKLPDEPAVPQTMPLPPPLPQPPKPEKDAFMPQTRVGAAKGSISNIGNHDAVNAAATPSGRYMRQVTAAIEKRWHYYRALKADFVEPCELLLHFYVDKNGKPENIKIDYNKANAVVTDFSITSVLEAKIPPIPADLIEILDNGHFEIEYHIVIY